MTNSPRIAPRLVFGSHLSQTPANDHRMRTGTNEIEERARFHYRAAQSSRRPTRPPLHDAQCLERDARFMVRRDFEEILHGEPETDVLKDFENVFR